MAAVVLTQPQPRVRDIAELMTRHGGQPVLLTFSELIGRAEALSRFASIDLAGFDRAVFVSPSSVDFAGPLLPALVRAIPRGIAAVGAGTVARLRSFAPDIEPIVPARAPYDAAALSALPAMSAQGMRGLLVLRGEQGREDWLQAYESRGVRVERIALYDTRRCTPGPDAVSALQAAARSAQPAISLVTSVGLAQRLLAWLAEGPAAQIGVGPANLLCTWLREQTCLVSHPRVGGLLSDAGFVHVIQPGSEESMSLAAVKWLAAVRPN